MRKYLLLLSLSFLVATAGFGYYPWTDSNGITYNYEWFSSQTTEVYAWISDCPESASVVIPASVSWHPVYSIWRTDYACQKNLVSVTISEGISTIGFDAFADCINLSSVVIPNSIIRIESCAFSGCKSLASITIPESVIGIEYGAFRGCSGLESFTIPPNVTTIESYVFSGCSNLTSIAIHNGVTSIEGEAFSECIGLKTISIPSSVTSIGYGAFRGCTSLSSLSLPENLSFIDYDAFRGCTNLTSIIIPDNVRSIGSYAFSDCDSLVSVTLPNNNLTLGSYMFNKCKSLTSITIPEGVVSIADGMFSGCSNLKSIVIPLSVTNIGNYAFSGCSSLESVTILNKNAKIGECAFIGCSRLADEEGFVIENGVLYAYEGDATEVVVPNSVKSIGSAAFQNCSNVASVVIQEGVTNIGAYAFADSKNLVSVTIPDGVRTIGYGAFKGCENLTFIAIPNGIINIANEMFNGCSNLVTVTIPNSVTNISSYAFKDCSKLESIDIPNNVAGIGSSVFSGCDSLSSITIPTSMTRIGNQAFMSCGGLKSITIPKNIKNIGYAAFEDCGKLETVTFSNGITNIGQSAFGSCKSLKTLTIPESVIKIGQNAFAYCEELETLTIKAGVKYIDSYAFRKCKNLVSVECLGGELNIGESAFADCKALSRLSLHDGITYIGYRAFLCCDSLRAVTIPDSVETIGVGAFSGCSNLVSVVIPDGLLSLGENAFSGCADSLYDTATIEGAILVDGWVVGYNALCPQNLDFKGARGFAACAFNGCTNLVTATIPSSVKHISSKALYGCKSLESILISEGVSSIGTEAFRYCQRLSSIVIPDSVTSIGFEALGGQLSEISISKDTKLGGQIGVANSKIIRRQEGEFPILYTNLKGRKISNPTIYKKGVGLTLKDPYAVTGYTFAGWTPSAITTDMTGVQVVRANWKGYSYQIIYNANGASGEMLTTDCEYGTSIILPENTFAREGYVFKGWAIEEKGKVVYVPGDEVKDLVTEEGNNISLYAIWEDERDVLTVGGDDGMYATIQDAIDLAKEGSTILVSPGTYEPINTQGKKIIIRSTEGAEKTKIVGSTTKGMGANESVVAALLISDDVYAQISDSRFQYMDEQGMLEVSSDRWYTYHRYRRFGNYRESIQFDLMQEWGVWTPESLGGSTLEGFTIEVNKIPEGEDPKDTYDNFYYGVVGGCLKNCYLSCYATRPVAGINGNVIIAEDRLSYVHMSLATAENCLIFSTQLDAEVVSDSSLRNCTVYSPSAMVNNELINTIVHGRVEGVVDNDDIYDSGAPMISDCVFYSGWRYPNTDGFIIADPLFNNITNRDFHLQANSPCIDKGGTAYGKLDLDGEARVVNGRVDIGCYEFVPSTAIATATNVVVTYDGEGHGTSIAVTFPEGDFTIEYSLSNEGPWQLESILVTNACTDAKIWYRVNAVGLQSLTNSVNVTVKPKELEKKMVSVSLPDGGYKYDGTAKEPVVLCKDGEPSIIGTEDFTVSYENNIDVGCATVTIAGKRNYIGEVVLHFTIDECFADVTFDALGGTFGDVSVVTQKQMCVYNAMPVDPKRANYVFKGWCLDVTDGAKVATKNGKWLVDGNHTLYARWEIESAVPTGTFVYSENGDGTISIKGLGTVSMSEKTLVIPDTIAGKPVTEIADKVFIGLENITSVTLPIFLERIGRRAFHNATSLKVLNIPAVRNWKNPSESGSLTIGEFAFAGTLLGEVRLPEEVTKIGNKAFNGCQRLTSVTILGAPSVGEDVFCNAGIAVSKSPTLRLSPDLAADEAYLSKLTSNFGRANLPVTVRTDAIVESVAPKGISVASDGSIELPVAVGRAANWGEVDASKVSVEYREKLTDAPTALEPRVKSNEGGSYSISVTPPKKASSGFFRVKVLK